MVRGSAGRRAAARRPVPQESPPVPEHRALYRRWRAQRFVEIVGQEAVVETLRNAVRLGRVGHAYLFVGPRGTGKTSMARILAKAINCTDLRDGEPCDVCPSCVAIREGRALDLLEIDAASNRGIDQIRELREKVRYAPTDLRRKIYILDEAHQVTRDGWAALLKTLEEPPGHVVFIFASTDPHEIPATILSRVQRFDFRRLRQAEIVGKLQRILAESGRAAEPEAIALVADLAAGGMRDAESMLDQLLSTADGRLTAERVGDLLGLADAASVDAFLAALVYGRALAGIAVLDTLEERGRDLRTFTEQVIERLRRVIAAQLAGRVEGVPPALATTDAGELARAARRLIGLDLQRARSGGPRFALELALLAPLVELPAAPLAVSGPSAGATPGLASVPGASAAGAERAEPSAARPEKAAPPPAPRADTHASVPMPPSASEALAAPSDFDLARLRERWAEIVVVIGHNPAARPLIEACRPLSIEGRTVILGFPEDKGFLAAALERRRGTLEKGISQVLGASFGVRCVATNVEAFPADELDEEAATLLEQARRIFGGEAAGVGDVS